MLLIGILLIGTIAASALLSEDRESKVIKEYCNLECKQDVLKKHKFCC